jgi:hypothetical protein
MVRCDFLVTAIVVAMMTGCVSDPIVYNIRMIAEIADVEERVLAFELIGPGVATRERAIYHGVLVSALLEHTDDTVADFSLGDVTLRELRRGRLKVLLTESGEARVHCLGVPTLPAYGLRLVVSAYVPNDPEAAVIGWAEACGNGIRQTK